jgi:hypothetical protein
MHFQALCKKIAIGQFGSLNRRFLLEKRLLNMLQGVCQSKF